MNEKAWDKLMRAARQEAALRPWRPRVMGIKLSDRSSRIMGSRWEYVVICNDPDCRICKARVLSW